MTEAVKHTLSLPFEMSPSGNKFKKKHIKYTQFSQLNILYYNIHNFVDDFSTIPQSQAYRRRKFFFRRQSDSSLIVGRIID
jgi:hypothetical protein